MQLVGYEGETPLVHAGRTISALRYLVEDEALVPDELPAVVKDGVAVRFADAGDRTR